MTSSPDYEPEPSRSIQAIAEGHDPGDLTTLDDPSTIELIQAAVAEGK